MATKNQAANIVTLDDDNDQQAAPVAPASQVQVEEANSHDAKFSGEKVIIELYEQEGISGRQPVFVSLNDYSALIPRGKPFAIPKEVFKECIEGATYSIGERSGKEVADRKVKRFAYTVHAA